MAVLHIHYSVPDYERWKRSFDRDVTNRQGSGVLRFRIHRVVTDKTLVVVDLELNNKQDAEALLVKMRRVWDVNGFTADSTPEAWIGERVESVELNQEPGGGAMSDTGRGREQRGERSDESEPKPMGKPSQAEGEDDDEQHEVKSPIGKPSQAEGDVGDSDAGQS